MVSSPVQLANASRVALMASSTQGILLAASGGTSTPNPSSRRLVCGCIRGGALYPAPLSKKRLFRLSVPSPHHLHRKTNEYNPWLVPIASFGTRLKSILLRSGQEGSNLQGLQPRGSSSLDLTVACIAAPNPILLLTQIRKTH